MAGFDQPGGRPRATWAPSETAQYLLLIARHWHLLILCSIVGVVAMFGVLMITGQRYDISAKLLVRIGREMTAPAILSAKDGAQVMPASKRPEDIASEVEILSNPRLIKRVVEHFGEDFFLAEAPPVTLWQHVKRVPKAAWAHLRDAIREGFVMVGLRPPTTPLERVIVAIGEGLRVEAVRKSDVIEVGLGFPDPQAGVQLLEKYIEYGLESHVQAHSTAGVREFFRRERDARNEELRAAEARLLALRKTHAAAWSAPEQRSLLLKNEADLLQQQTQTLADAAQAAAEVEHAGTALKSLPSEIRLSSAQARNRTGDELRGRLVQLELDLVNLKSRYAEGSPEVRDVERQIEILTRTLATEPAYHLDVVTTGANQQYEALARDLVAKQNLLQGQKARAAEIAEQIARLRGQLRAVETAEIDIAQAERDVVRIRRAVDLYEKGLEDARIAEAMDGAALSSLQVIMPPTAELLPSYPPMRRFLLLGFAGGLSLGCLLVVGRDLWRRYRPPAGPLEADNETAPPQTTPQATPLPAAGRTAYR